MAAVMQESVSLLREELHAEIKKIEDATQQLTLRVEAQESFCKDAEIRKVEDAMQQLTFKVEAQGSLCKDAEIQKVKVAMQQLILRVEAQESICKVVAKLSKEVKQHSDALKSQQYSVVLDHLQAIQAHQKGIFVSFEQELEKIRSDCVHHKDLAIIKDQMGTNNSGKNCILKNTLVNDKQDAQSTCATNDVHNAQETLEIFEHVDRQISELHSNVSQIKFQMQAMSTNWEATRGAALSELRKQGAATKESVDEKIADVLSEIQQHRVATREHVDERLSELYFVLSQIKGQQEAKHLSKINDEHMTDQLLEIRADVEEVQRGLSEHSVQLSHEKELTAMMESTSKQVSQMRSEIQDLQTQLLEGNLKSNYVTYDVEALREATKEYVNEKNSELYSHLSEVQAKQEPIHRSKINDGCMTNQLLEMRADADEMQRRLSERSVQPQMQNTRTPLSENDLHPDVVSRSHLGVTMEATKEYVTERNSKLQPALSNKQVSSSEVMDEHVNDEVFDEENGTSPEQIVRGHQLLEEEISDSSENLVHGRLCILHAVYPSAEKIVHPHN